MPSLILQVTFLALSLMEGQMYPRKRGEIEVPAFLLWAKFGKKEKLRMKILGIK
jgi:hypothetical protein